MINKIIHQIWISESDNEVPYYCKELSETWREHHPDYDYILWDKTLTDELLKQKYPHLKPLLQDYAYNIQKIDVFKYLILYEMGGLYVDLDYECIKPVFDIFSNHDCYLVEESSEFRIIGNAFIACKKKSSFLEIVINSLRSYLDNDLLNKSDKLNHVLLTTGPGMIGAAYQNYHNREDVSIIPSKFLSPITALESRELFKLSYVPQAISQKLTSAYAIHYFFSLWIN